MQLRVENWNGYPIRFVEIDGDWLAITTDVSKALGYLSAERLLRRIPKKYQVKKLVPRNGVSGQGRVFILLKEIGIYQAVFGSHKPEAQRILKTVQQKQHRANKERGISKWKMLTLNKFWMN